MARPRDFDEQEVLTAAMHLFRREGFQGTSIKALEETTGLPTGSLYNAFGSKEALFARALEHYVASCVEPRIRTSFVGRAPLDGIRTLFLALPYDQEHVFGCLMTNSAVEFGGTASLARQGVAHGLGLLENAFDNALEKMSEEPRFASLVLDDAAVRKRCVTKLLSLYLGIWVLVRHGRPVAEIAEMCRNEIDSLFGGRQ